MKETKIAKENVQAYIEIKNVSNFIRRETHLTTLKRFLEFLENGFDWSLEQDICKDAKKIFDIQNAIKIYEEVGVK